MCKILLKGIVASFVLITLLLTGCEEEKKADRCRFLPLAVGNWWRYSGSNTQNGQPQGNFQFKLTVDDYRDDYFGKPAWHISFAYEVGSSISPSVDPSFAEGWYAYDEGALFKNIENQWWTIISQELNLGDYARWGVFIDIGMNIVRKYKSEEWGEVIEFSGHYERQPPAPNPMQKDQGESYAAYIGSIGFVSEANFGQNGSWSDSATLIDYYVQ